MHVVAYVQLGRLVKPTGVGRVIDCLCRHLCEQDGIHISVLSSRSDFKARHNALPSWWQHAHYSLFPAPVRMQQASWLFLGQPPAARYFGKADVLWVTTECYVPGARCPNIVSVHDLHYFDLSDSPVAYPAYVRLKWRITFQRVVKRADRIHAVSAFTAERLSHYFPEASARIEVVPNPVDPVFFGQANKEAIYRLQNLGLNQRLFVFKPGGLSYRKNASLVGEVWRRVRREIPNAWLVIAGSSSPYWEGTIGSPSEQVQTLGYVDDELLLGLYQCAAVVWFPSRYEGFGIPVLEAMAAGAPVLGSNAGALPEVAGEAALLGGVDDVGFHAEALVSLLTSQKLREAYAARGREQARRFAAPIVAAQFSSLLKSML